jgi:hypothetical protein
MLLKMMGDCDPAFKYKVMQSLRNMTAGCSDLHPVLVGHPSFVPWLLRATASQKSSPSVEDRMMHVQALGLVWNLCNAPDSAERMLAHGVFDSLTMVLEMPFSDTQEIALLAFADIASSEHGRLQLLDSRLAVTLCGLAKSVPPPSAGVYEGVMRIFFALSETEDIKSQKSDGEGLQKPRGRKTPADGLAVDEHFFKSMGIIETIAYLLRNGGEMTKLLALGWSIIWLARMFVADAAFIRDSH